jgi:cytochrome P450
VNPAIYRRATRTTVIAPNTLRALTVPKGTMVFASNLSAMFDRLKIGHPGDFRINRPWESYILWGDGMHACFGAHINRAVIPAILKPLLARRRLQRVPGGAGQIDTEGTPFPVHLWLQFEPG